MFGEFELKDYIYEPVKCRILKINRPNIYIDCVNFSLIKTHTVDLHNDDLVVLRKANMKIKNVKCVIIRGAITNIANAYIVFSGIKNIEWVKPINEHNKELAKLCGLNLKKYVCPIKAFNNMTNVFKRIEDVYGEPIVLVERNLTLNETLNEILIEILKVYELDTLFKQASTINEKIAILKECERVHEKTGFNGISSEINISSGVDTGSEINIDEEVTVAPIRRKAQYAILMDNIDNKNIIDHLYCSHCKYDSDLCKAIVCYRCNLYESENYDYDY